MDVLPDEEQLTVQAAAHEFLEGECPPQLVRVAEKEPGQFSSDLWRKFAGNGWLQLCISEKHGGEALPLTYLGLLFEVVGHHIAPLPVHGTAVASLLLDRHGGATAEPLLQSMLEGRSIFSLAIAEAGGEWSAGSISTSLAIDGSELVINGEKHFVPGFASSTHCLVACRDAAGAPALVIVPTSAAGLESRELVSLAKDGEATLQLRDVRVPAGNRLGKAGEGAAILEEAMNLSAVLHACLMSGAARRTLDMAVEHATQREAFGQPIGAFQAIQHMCANMLNAVDGTMLLTREALWRMQQGLPAARHAAQAKSFANEHCMMVCRSAQQIHGGMGFMIEFDLNLWYRRIAAWSTRSGTVKEHRRTIASALLGASGDVRIGNVPG